MNGSHLHTVGLMSSKKEHPLLTLRPYGDRAMLPSP